MQSYILAQRRSMQLNYTSVRHKMATTTFDAHLLASAGDRSLSPGRTSGDQMHRRAFHLQASSEG